MAMYGGDVFSVKPEIKATLSAGGKIPEMETAAAFLREGEIKNCQLVPTGSNYVYLLSMKWKGETALAIYKPRRGEAPLWDFPDGTLYKRELAAYLVSRALNWQMIPPTIIKEGPYGIGMFQWFVITGQMSSYSRLLENHGAGLKRTALFDWLVNNADRKVGHCLVDLEGRLWLIDHGLTFNDEPKLRTVIWDFMGQKVPSELLNDLESLSPALSQGELCDALNQLLSRREMQALKDRLNFIVRKPVFPAYFGSQRRIPWPPY
jgi:uncharacterized repeat protein (TIGR03843 family)